MFLPLEYTLPLEYLLPKLYLDHPFTNETVYFSALLPE